jgi:hypothetical protein
MEHSCVPNCHFLFDKQNGFKLTVRAARDIKKGEHIATCYSNVLWGTLVRRQHLHDMKYFLCRCERCADPFELKTHLSSLKCIGIDDSGCDGIQASCNPLEDGDWMCNKCSARVSYNEVAEIIGKMNEEIDQTMEKEATVPAIETLMGKLSTFLHPNHYHMFTLKHTLIQLYGNHRDYAIETMPVSFLKRKLRFCDDLLEIVERLDPYNIRLSIYTAVILYEKFNAIVETRRRQLNEIPHNNIDALKCLQRAQVVLINESDSLQGRRLLDKITNSLKIFKI